MGYTRGSRVVPRRKQLGKKPDEALPSRRGDARAAERARTGGAKTARRRDQRISELDRCVLRQISGDRLRRKRISSKKLRSIDRLAFTVSDKEQHGLLTATFCYSHKREEIRSASRVDRLWFSGLPADPL
jgi:hypothetical protein